MLDAGCWILDARYSMLDARYSILDAGLFLIEYLVPKGGFPKPDQTMINAFN
jgi:hypothetical protein